MNDTDGSRLKAWRKKNDLSQRDLATILERSQSFVGNIEAGKTGLSRDLINRMAERTSVNVSWLLTGDGPMEVSAPSPVSSTPTSEEVRAGKIDPIRLMACGSLVEQEYRAAERPLPQDLHFTEAVWVYNEVLSRVSDPNDGDEMEAVMPQVRHLLRKRIKQKA